MYRKRCRSCRNRRYPDRIDIIVLRCRCLSRNRRHGEGVAVIGRHVPEKRGVLIIEGRCARLFHKVDRGIIRDSLLDGSSTPLGRVICATELIIIQLRIAQRQAAHCELRLCKRSFRIHPGVRVQRSAAVRCAGAVKNVINGFIVQNIIIVFGIHGAVDLMRAERGHLIITCPAVKRDILHLIIVRIRISRSGIFQCVPPKPGGAGIILIIGTVAAVRVLIRRKGAICRIPCPLQPALIAAAVMISQPVLL